MIVLHDQEGEVNFACVVMRLRTLWCWPLLRHSWVGPWSFNGRQKMTPEKFFIWWLLKEFERKRSTDHRNKIACKYYVQKYFGFQKLRARKHKNTQIFEIAQLKTRLKSEALRRFLGRYLENPTMNLRNTKICSWHGLKRLNGGENESFNIRIKMISGFKPITLSTITTN